MKYSGGSAHRKSSWRLAPDSTCWIWVSRQDLTPLNRFTGWNKTLHHLNSDYIKTFALKVLILLYCPWVSWGFGQNKQKQHPIWKNMKCQNCFQTRCCCCLFADDHSPVEFLGKRLHQYLVWTATKISWLHGASRLTPSTFSTIGWLIQIYNIQSITYFPSWSLEQGN